MPETFALEERHHSPCRGWWTGNGGIGFGRAFRAPARTAGSRTIRVIRLGYSDGVGIVEVPAGGVLTIDFALAPTAVPHTGVDVESERRAQTEVREVRQSPFAVTVIDGQRLAGRGLTLDEALRGATGVHVRRSGGLGSASVFNIGGLEVSTCSLQGETMIVTPPRFLGRLRLASIAFITFTACQGDSAGRDPGSACTPDILLVTSVADASGIDGSSFIQSVSLDRGSVTNADAFEGVIRDDCATGPGRYGYNHTMFVDEAGDLYVYCVASFGFAPGQTAGILRIRRGESAFDPSYFVDPTNASANVPGGRIGLLNGIGYGGVGILYGMAQVPALQSNPPSYATDRAFQAVRITLATGAGDAVPLPLNNGIATGVTVYDGRILFGLSTSAGVGIYSYGPATNQTSSAPVLTTVGDPTHVLALAP